MALNKTKVFGELSDMFYDVQPDSEYLEEDEGTTENIKDIQRLLDDNSAPIEKKIEALSAFNTEWFPDGLPENEQKAYKDLLDQARTIKS
jgi:hypothetical protein